MASVAVRTAAGDVLSIPTTPADVVGRCPECRRGYREGDWYCDHLATRFGHQVAWLADQSTGGPSAAAGTEPAISATMRVAPAAFAVTFASPTL